ncbi:MAG: EthD family reductase [Proteobacteria bacterium]|nr:EthD family reductase [Pseudomonadota bacterium]
MIKRITILTRKDGMSDEEFGRRWHGQHAEMVRNLPGVCGYTQNKVLPAAGTPADPVRRVDGFAEIWFESADAMASALASPQWTAIVADAHEFLGAMAGYSIDERVVVPVSPRG